MKAHLVFSIALFLSLLFGQDSPSGSLVIIGGGLEAGNAGVYRNFIECAGGAKRIQLAIVPAGSVEPWESARSCASDFQNYGVPSSSIEILPVACIDDPSTSEVDESTWAQNAFRPEIARRISRHNAVFFVGGDQVRYRAVLQRRTGEDSPLLAGIRRVFRTGGVLGGTSAGAAIMSDPMICGGGSRNALALGVTPENESGVCMSSGLGFFRHGLVDQHFLKRGRLGRLVVALLASKHSLGFGIDEDTALLCRGTSVHVVGASGVLVVDVSRAKRSRDGEKFHARDVMLHYLQEGDSFDCERRTATVNSARRKIEPGEERNLSIGAGADIFEKDEITRGITAGLIDHSSREFRGCSRDPKRPNSGFCLLFRKTPVSLGYRATVRLRDSWTATGLLLDIAPLEDR